MHWHTLPSALEATTSGWEKFKTQQISKKEHQRKKKSTSLTVIFKLPLMVPYQAKSSRWSYRDNLPNDIRPTARMLHASCLAPPAVRNNPPTRPTSSRSESKPGSVAAPPSRAERIPQHEILYVVWNSTQLNLHLTQTHFLGCLRLIITLTVPAIL